jgi:DNA-binding HxlR family transcriptional regulator
MGSDSNKELVEEVIDNQHSARHKDIAKVLHGACAKVDICPIKDIIARFGDKWSVYTILLIGQYGKRRFNQLKSGIPGISQRMLTVTLRTLAEDGIISGLQYQNSPVRLEYALTDLGTSLLDQIVSLANWAEQHHKEILSSRMKYATQA